MPMRQQWRGSDLVVLLDKIPLRNLSDEDGAITVRYLNPRTETPRNDLNNEAGVHVVAEDTNLEITIRVPIGATTTLARLQTYFDTRMQIRTMEGVNVGSDTSGFTASNIQFNDMGPWGGGKNPEQYEFVLHALRGRIVFGGQRILP